MKNRWVFRVSSGWILGVFLATGVGETRFTGAGPSALRSLGASRFGLIE